MTLPAILAMAASNRGVEENVFHVTEILNPPQVVYLSRKTQYFAPPHSLVNSLLGTGFHSVMEKGHSMLTGGMADRFESEQPFSIEIAGCILTGRPDLYDRATKTLIDYKTIKLYAVKLLKEGHFDDSKYKDQINIYRTFKYPEAEHLILEVVSKDWMEYNWKADGIYQIEDIEVPMEPMTEMRAMVECKILEHKQALETGRYRQCTDDERWLNRNPRSKNYGKYTRCMGFCSVSKNCEQCRSTNES